MTDHPKPIARYYKDIYGIHEPDGRQMNESHVLETLNKQDARIAELEREAIKSADRLHEARSDSHKLSALRTAIEAKAREWNEQADVASVMSGDPDTAARVEAWRQAASELRALLEKKP